MKTQPDASRYRVSIGNQLTWYPKAERWRIDVVGSQRMQGVFIAHKTLVGVTSVDSYDLSEVAGLVQIHRNDIEEAIGQAELENWPDRLGILPHFDSLG
jgi:hypothetical protein